MPEDIIGEISFDVKKEGKRITTRKAIKNKKKKHSQKEARRKNRK
jgi:hypothetical protein